MIGSYFRLKFITDLFIQNLLLLNSERFNILIHCLQLRIDKHLAIIFYRTLQNVVKSKLKPL
jgi:hypothetical protein